eukprot:scaffold24544_cov175-Skeletonema_marinoi.AAC.1
MVEALATSKEDLGRLHDRREVGFAHINTLFTRISYQPCYNVVGDLMRSTLGWPQLNCSTISYPTL